MNRFYCWRVGAVIEMNVGDKCPECGCTDHNTYGYGNCGNFVELPAEKRTLDHVGTNCVLPINHPGSCSHDLEIIAEEIHDS
jgi:hypothetical protein